MTLKFKAMHGVELQHGRNEAVSFSPHFHEEFQILVVLDGCLRLTVSGQEHVVAPPAICLVNPLQVHAGGAQGWGWECRNFYVSQKISARLMGADDRCASVFPKTQVHDVALAHRLAAAHERACADVERSGALSEALAILFRRYAVSAPPGDAERMHPGVQMALLHLRARYVEPIRIQTLARMSGLSRFHFLRTFARAIGMTPHAYQNQLRLALAVRRLRESAPAAQAAAECGFYDQSHLMRVLRRSHGLTPALLKRANLKRNFVQ
jgi:AraC-like DNA-binding protein